MRWTVGAKLGSGFGVGVVILIVLSIVSYRSMTLLVDTANWVTHSKEVLGECSSLILGLTEAETGQRGFLITGEDGYLDPYQSGLKLAEGSRRTLRSLTTDNEKLQRRLDTLDSLISTRLASLKEGIELRRTKGAEAAHEFVRSGKGQGEMKDIRELLDEVMEDGETLLQARNQEAAASVSSARSAIWVGTITALITMLVAGILITRSISRPLAEITAAATRMADGDLDVVLPNRTRSDEVGVLTRAFAQMTESLRNMADIARTIAEGDLRSTIEPRSDRDQLGNAFATMVQSLRRMTSDIIEGASVLGAAAAQIVASSAQLATSSAQTATAVAETTTTVEEVRQTAQVSTQKARAVAESAQNAATVSREGKESIDKAGSGTQRIREQMESIAQSMIGLSEQTQAIGQIITTVDDLAQQSNLLAVNASIEAAKAGEQGRGFKVVAQEVKSLAEQSKGATTQVRKILDDIQRATGAAVMATEQGTKAVEVGTTQSVQAGNSIIALASSASEASQAASQIAASSQQQLVGMEQIVVAMESIKQATSQNVESAKQLEGAARSIDELGRRLRETVSKYKLGCEIPA